MIEKSFKDDVARRDFTINAMGIDCRGNLIDYYNGEKDLDDNILRFLLVIPIDLHVSFSFLHNS